MICDCSPAEGVVIPTEGGEAKGANCAFPFMHEGKEQYECVEGEGEGGQPWCVTTNGLRGFCVYGEEPASVTSLTIVCIFFFL